METPNPLHSQAPKKPTKDNLNKPPSLRISPTKPNYTHQSLKALTLKIRGMHTTIKDLHKILTTQPDPHIIALTETKHRHIKSIWRQTLRNYKLVFDPSHYNKHTKRCSGGTILAIQKNAYSTIKPLYIPPPYQPYLAIALLTPKAGSEILAIVAYLPQHQTKIENQTYKDTLHWLHILLTIEHPNIPVLLGRDL